MKEEEERKKKQDKQEKSSEKDEEDKQEENTEDNGKQKPNSGNGGETNLYKWTQTLEEVCVFVPLPENTVAKQLDIKMMNTKLEVGLKSQPEKFIDGKLHKKIKTDDSIWTVE